MSWTRAAVRTVARRVDRVTDPVLQRAADAAVAGFLALGDLAVRLRDATAGRCPEAPDGRHTWAQIRIGGIWYGDACEDCTFPRPSGVNR